MAGFFMPVKRFGLTLWLRVSSKSGEMKIMKKNDLWKFVFAMAVFPSSLLAANITGTVTSTTGMMGGGATPVNGVKIIMLDNTSSGTKQDSATTGTNGTYTLTNPGASGQKVLVTSQPGYNPSATAFAYNGTALTENIALVINNNTSTIAGKVLVATKPLDSALVTLTGGTLTTARSVRTDTNGNYAFDSVGTGTRYTVSVSSAKYQTVTQANVTATWNATTTVGTITLVKNLGKLSGTVKSAATGTPAIKTGVHVGFYTGGLEVDSVVTDTLGNYSDSLNAAAYTVTFSAAGYKSDSDLPALDTSVTVVFNMAKTLNASLTPAAASIGGTITRTGTPPIPVTGAQITLQHRMTNVGTASTSWVNVDSSVTDANGLYDFTNLIAGAAANYRIHIQAVWSTGTLDTISAAVNVTAGMAVTLNFTAKTPVALFTRRSAGANHIEFSLTGGRLLLNLGEASHAARTVSIFDMHGALQYRISVPANASKVMAPAAFSPAKGFLFQLK